MVTARGPRRTADGGAERGSGAVDDLLRAGKNTVKSRGDALFGDGFAPGSATQWDLTVP